MSKLIEEMTVIEATLASGTLAESPANGGPSGRKWRVRIFEYGLSKNRYPYSSNGSHSANRQELPATALPLLWTERSARAALKHLEGARCFADHVSEGNGNGHSHSVRDLVGYYSDAQLGPGGLEATLTLLESEDWARAKLLAAWQAGRTDLIGFSIDAVIGVRPVGEGAARALEVEEIVAIQSVDMVSTPSSGGRALDVLEGRDGSYEGLPSAAKAARKSRSLTALGMTPEVPARAAETARLKPCPDGRGSHWGTEGSLPHPSTSSGQAGRGSDLALTAPSRSRLGFTRGPDASGGATGSEKFVLCSIPRSARERDTQSISRKGVTMKEEIKRMLEALRPANGGDGNDAAMLRLREALESELADPEVNGSRALAALADWLSSQGFPEDELSPEISRVREQVKSLRQQISDAVRRQRVAENRLLLDGKLAASRLPKPLADLVSNRFRTDGPYAGRGLSEEEIEMEIQRVREAYAALSPVGKVMETGRTRVLQEPEDKLQMALDRLFGLPVEDASVQGFHGIREAYVTYTGDGEVTGTIPSPLRIREDITSSTFTNALGNTLRRLLLKDYREQDYGIGLIAQFASVPDFRTQERVRVGYFGDLPTLDPEAADYGELTAPTDEKATYSVVTFGGLVTITRKMIINDDLGVVPQIVTRLGRAARRTLAQRVFNLMINNAAIYDSVAWFHATHGNLGSTALSATELNAVRTAMRNRTEKDSGKKLGIAPYVLVVPHELEGTARQTNERQYTDSNFTPNPVRFMFGQASERVIISPLLSDANDWYVFANRDEAPTVEVGFLQGKQEPEFFLADNPTVGSAFTSDRIRYKVRHEHEAVVIDYRGAYKEVVV